MHSAYGTRLLSIGEIFDRAVHITVANLLPLATIVGIVAVPTRAIGDWFSRDAMRHSFVADGKIVADPRLFSQFFVLNHDPHANAINWSVLFWFLASLFPLSLAIAAASIASRAFLKGEIPTLGAAYRSAARRLVPIIGASILAWATYIAGVVAITIVWVVCWVAWFMIDKTWGGAVASVPGAVFTGAFLAAFVATIAWLTPLANCTFTGAVLYVVRPFRALREAWSMTMSRGQRRRSLAFGAAFLALTVVQEFIRLVVCGSLSDVTHSPWLSFVASDLITLLALMLWTVLAVVFYLDARNRMGFIQDQVAEQENSKAR
jgi:hypothetical protein